MANRSRRKAFGQNFLVDQKIILKIVEETFLRVDQSQSITLLEVGPGRGAITEHLLNHYQKSSTLKHFHIVEMDRKFADHWTLQTKEINGVNVISQDMLKVDLPPLFEHSPVTVVSNLPYSSGTAILNQLSDFPQKIAAMVLMFQKEVADRVKALPDTSDWGSLSLWVQNRWDVTKVIAVPPRAFQPPPKVQSEVVLLTPRKSPRIENSLENLELFNQFLRISFQHRRKMIRSSLPKDSVFYKTIADAEIPETERVERLTWDQWNRWFQIILSKK